MNKMVKLIFVLLAVAGYFVILRYLAPSREPYFVLGLGLIGYAAWLYGIFAGVAMTLLLIPLTFYAYNSFEISISYNTFTYSPAYIAIELLAAVTLGRLRNKTVTLSKKETVLAESNKSLQTTLLKVREIGGVHSLCTSCKSILDDDGVWKKIDLYLKEKTKAEFSHGICPDCVSDYANKDT